MARLWNSNICFDQLWKNCPKVATIPSLTGQILVRRRMPFANNGNKEEAMSYVSLLKACAKKKDLQRGMDVHSAMLETAGGLLETNPFIGSSLIHMYAKCGDLPKAQKVLDELPVRNSVCWNAMISGYAQQGQGKEAVYCFNLMQREGFSPHAITFTSVLKACGSIGALDKGIQIHEMIVRERLLGEDIVLGNALIDMYAKCNVLTKAQQVFDGLPNRDVVSWNALISGYTKHGHYMEALESFAKMKMEGLFPNPITLTSILKACGSTQEINKGKQIHDDITNRNLLAKDVVLGNALVDMYVSCDALAKATEVFEELPLHDVVSWNVIISGFANKGLGEEALNYYELMQKEGVYPDIMIFSCILKACGSIGAINKGKQIHHEMVSKGLIGNNTYLDTVLMDINTVHAKHGQDKEGLSCHKKMFKEVLFPSINNLTSNLKPICVVDNGKETHGGIVSRGLLETYIVLGTALLDMYSRCGALNEAKHIHDELPIRDVISWNALIFGYVQQEQDEEALGSLSKMQDESLSPNAITFTCILKACASIGAIDKGEKIHNEIVNKALIAKDTGLGNALVDMYVKCGELAKARQLLDDLSVRNKVSWSVLIAGYTQHGRSEEVLNCFEQMKNEGIAPSPIIFTSVLKACSNAGAIDKGKQIHEEIICQGLLKHDVVLGSALVDMYARCGWLSKAQEVLNELPNGNVVTWSSLIAGYAQQGQGKEALDCFKEMQSKNMLCPNSVTFLSILHACSHAGLVEEGLMYFEDMSKTYNITPNFEHYTCIVDLLGRAGHIDRAFAVIKKMPCSDYAPLWGTFLGSCRKWGNIKLAELAFEYAIQLDNSNDAAYVSMMNIYAAASMQKHVENVKAMRMKNTCNNK